MEGLYHINYNFIKEPMLYGDVMLFQLGRLFCTSNTLIKKHAHLNWFELTVVTDGEGVVSTNDHPFLVKKGDIHISYPGDFHEISSSADKPLKYDFFSFSPRNEAMKKELKDIAYGTQVNEQRIFNDRQINLCISSAISEFMEKKEFHTELIGLLANQIVYYAIRGFRNTIVKNPHASSADTLCFKLMNYIDTHIYSIDTLAKLSDKFSYNYSYLSNLFKRTTGNTLNSYYQSRRLDTARLLIDEGKLKISEIADMLKYSSLYSFSKAFKSKFGLSPKHYAKSARHRSPAD